ncbi:zinc-dependent metalloprotease family protein [Urechidicola sp. KH5]
MKMKFPNFVFGLFMLLSITTNAQSNDGLWTKMSDTDKQQIQNQKDLDQKKYYQLNFESLRTTLENAPKRGEVSGRSSIVVQFPDDKGVMQSFSVVEAPVFSPELQARYPEIRSYAGQGIDNPTATIRFSISPQKGLSSTVLSNGKTVFIERLTKDSENYLVYTRSANSEAADFVCETEYMKSNTNFDMAAARNADDGKLRTFRLALACTGEYATFHGGTEAGVLAAMNATMTRVNGVFERDVALTMVMVDNTSIIFYDADTDPYTNSNGGAMLGQNQTTCDNNIGTANYDIGHVFSTGGGGVAYLNSPCNGNKAGGVTGSSSPQGDTFDIDYVAHEMGHQYGGNHTQNNPCNASAVSVEPGSASTIMGYAGICAPNVQNNSDDYFHGESIKEMWANISTGASQCAAQSDTYNAAPVANAGADFTIPASTPFVLNGAATDADTGDALTYCWEQIDAQFATMPPVSTSTGGPAFRSLLPNTSPDRYMPDFSTVLGGSTASTWEVVPSVSRTMNFSLTVRDNVAGGAGSGSDEMIVTVDDAAGPFAVTSQTAAVTWDAGTTQTITWDVAGTDSGAVNTPNVDIYITPDNGATFVQVANDVPNNGSADITVPLGAITSNGRVMVRGAGNIFYAINSANITIQESEFVMAFANTTQDICAPGSIDYNFTYNTFLGFTETTTFSAAGNPAGTTVSFSPTSASVDATAVTLTVSGITDAMAGNHTITITGTSASVTKSVDVSLNVYSASFNALVPYAPADGAVGVLPPAVLEWNIDSNATTYFVEVASDSGFTTIAESATVSGPSYETTTLDVDTMYYWRVTPSNDCGSGTASAVSSFTTANIVCDSFASTDVPVSISSSGTPQITSTLLITEGVSISDLDVQIDVTHTWISDLTVSLTSPEGTTIILSGQNGSNGDDYSNTYFDDEATTAITGGTPPYAGSFIPEEALSTFDGEASVGTWTLTISDAFNMDGGSLNSWTVFTCGEPISDADADGVEDDVDNCPTVANADQADLDGDDIGDVCDDDDDNDGILDTVDNCPTSPNTDQSDIDGDGIGDTCDDDIDGDSILNGDDNCPLVANSDQSDIDGDGFGDACDDDMDGDGIMNADDNCPMTPNPDQSDNDSDGIGDICDDDDDNDLVLDIDDNCPMTPNADQSDVNFDGIGDVCEDCDGDGIINYYDEDSCEMIVNEGFSPNNDGNNDTWIIENIELYPNNKVQVFNRWGTLVYEKVGYENTWDGVATKGSSNGDKLPVGSYFYTLESNELGVPNVQGWLYINY